MAVNMVARATPETMATATVAYEGDLYIYEPSMDKPNLVPILTNILKELL